MRKKASQKGWTKTARTALKRKFKNCFGFDPGGQGMLRKMEQALVNDKVGKLHLASCDCIGEMETIIKPYAEAVNADSWRTPPLIRAHYLQVKELDEKLDSIGRQIIVATRLANAFEFDVKPASFYGYPDTRPFIHKEVDQIVAKVHQNE